MIFRTTEQNFVKTFRVQETRRPETYTAHFVETKQVNAVQSFFLLTSVTSGIFLAGKCNPATASFITFMLYIMNMKDTKRFSTCVHDECR